MTAVPPTNVRPKMTGIASVSVTSSTSTFDALDLGGSTLSAIQMSTAWTDASLTFQASLDGTNYFDVYSSTGGEIACTTTASRLLVFDPATFLGLPYIKVRSGTSGTGVNQAAARTISLGLVKMAPSQ